MRQISFYCFNERCQQIQNKISAIVFFTNLINFQHFSSLLAGCTHLTSYAVVQFGAVVFDVRNKLLEKKDAYN